MCKAGNTFGYRQIHIRQSVLKFNIDKRYAPPNETRTLRLGFQMDGSSQKPFHLDEMVAAQWDPFEISSQMAIVLSVVYSLSNENNLFGNQLREQRKNWYSSYPCDMFSNCLKNWLITIRVPFNWNGLVAARVPFHWNGLYFSSITLKWHYKLLTTTSLSSFLQFYTVPFHTFEFDKKVKRNKYIL